MKLVDTGDSKTPAARACRFESGLVTQRVTPKQVKTHVKEFSGSKESIGFVTLDLTPLLHLTDSNYRLSSSNQSGLNMPHSS